MWEVVLEHSLTRHSLGISISLSLGRFSALFKVALHVGKRTSVSIAT